jgi:multidrug efflux pump subunit AcrA (membrane-fusion protein)
MNLRHLILVLGLSIVAVAVVVGFWTFPQWREWLPFERSAAPEEDDEHHHAHEDELKLSPQAMNYLDLKLQEIQFRKDPVIRYLRVPGTIEEQPGKVHVHVAAPVAGVVRKIYRFPPEVVKPGDLLFRMQILSEALQNVQAQLYRTARDLEINQDLQKRLRETRDGPELFKARLMELGYEQQRLEATQKTHLQELRLRLPADYFTEHEKELAAGLPVFFDHLLDVKVPGDKPIYQVEELKVKEGEMVVMGQSLGVLGNHQELRIEARAFEQDAALVYRALKNRWPVRLELTEAAGSPLTERRSPGETGQPPVDLLELQVTDVSFQNDPGTQTVQFFLPLSNEYQEVRHEGSEKPALIWRFLKGQRVRLAVKVGEYPEAPAPGEEPFGVYVLPVAAVARDGAEAYVFRQNGDILERKSVRILFADETQVVIDGRSVRDEKRPLREGQVLAHNAADILNMALKAQTAGGGGGHDHHGHAH